MDNPIADIATTRENLEKETTWFIKLSQSDEFAIPNANPVLFIPISPNVLIIPNPIKPSIKNGKIDFIPIKNGAKINIIFLKQ